MNKFVSLYVTSTKNGGELLDPKTVLATVNKVAAEFSKKFGGCTATPGTGYWLSDTKGLIAEQVVIIKSYHELETKDALAVVLPLAQYIKREFNQEAVSVETELGLEFI